MFGYKFMFVLVWFLFTFWSGAEKICKARG
jgi:hypothetical protein